MKIRQLVDDGGQQWHSMQDTLEILGLDSSTQRMKVLQKYLEPGTYGSVKKENGDEDINLLSDKGIEELLTVLGVNETASNLVRDSKKGSQTNELQESTVEERLAKIEEFLDDNFVKF